MEKEIEELVSDQNKFNAFIYTPLEDAVKEIEQRASDEALSEYAKAHLPVGRPALLDNRKCAVLFRQVATPNYEFRRFVSLVDGLDDYTPVVFEYYEDKFVDKNEFKYYLGMLAFFCGRGKKGGEKLVYLNVIDFNTSRGKKLSEIKTPWGQGLIEFHHELMENEYGSKVKKAVTGDLTGWLKQNGIHAAEYYKNYLSLFLQKDILFENFMLDSKEMSFTKEIFLPAFLKIYKETGRKPLIVALEPTDIESEVFWMCHPAETLAIVQKKLQSLDN